MDPASCAVAWPAERNFALTRVVVVGGVKGLTSRASAMTKAGQQHSKLPTRPAVVYYNPIEQVLQRVCIPCAAASHGARGGAQGEGSLCVLATGDQLPHAGAR